MINFLPDILRVCALEQSNTDISLAIQVGSGSQIVQPIIPHTSLFLATTKSAVGPPPPARKPDHVFHIARPSDIA